ncbi:hypothetical protein HDU93_010104 [Gonapodya sp. JEL0774]|nr:hypothetical protein HDU93_010104 [Gonapodya sp. JEL0774]
MPVLHFVGFPFPAGTEDKIPNLAEALKSGGVPGEMVHYGPVDLARSQGVTQVLYGIFDKEEDLAVYGPHPGHLQTVKDLILPNLPEGKPPIVFDVNVPASVVPSPKGKVTHVVAFNLKEGHEEDWAKGFKQLAAAKAEGLPGNLLFGGKLMPGPMTAPYNHGEPLCHCYEWNCLILTCFVSSYSPCG